MKKKQKGVFCETPCVVFCVEIKWIDVSILICDRTYFWQQTIWSGRYL